jgi:hypothetical protein
MNVIELIELLKKQNPYKRVVISGYESGYDDITSIGDIDLVLDVHTALYYGKHDTPEKSDDSAIESCILISDC